MSRIVVFGAGGRAGRLVVAEALRRGHEVTAVVRDPAAHADLAKQTVVLAGDVTNPDSVANAAGGQDAAITTAVRLDLPATDFYSRATTALLAGLDRAEVRRLVAVGIGSTLESAPGIRLLDASDFPPEFRTFSLGHLVQLDLLRANETELDWVVLAPPPTMLDDTAPRTGRYQLGDTALLPADPDGPLFAYADLAVALLDQVDNPTRHRELAAVAPSSAP